MICPKCKKEIDDKSTICPHCKKVLLLECPRCGCTSETSTCSNCGYISLSKCTKCGTLNKTSKNICSKCGESTVTSAVKRLTENEHYASITINFSNIGKFGKTLGNKNLITKFLFKLKNMLTKFAKEEKAYFIMYKENIFILNYINESSEYISAQKAMKSGIKLLNIICNLNRTLKKELMFTLEARITIEKKELEHFFDINEDSEKVKLLDLYTEQSNESKGLILTADQYIYKLLKKEYSMESLYSTERKGEILSYYILKSADYIVPEKTPQDEVTDISASPVKIVTKKEIDYEQELYKKNIEGIKVKCKFEQYGADEALEYLQKINFSAGNRIISLRGDSDRMLPTSVISNTIIKNTPCYTVICTEQTAITPWGFFNSLLKEIYENNINKITLGTNSDKLLESFLKLSPPNYETAENARLAYIEVFILLLTSLPQSTIYIENFEYIDMASLRVLEEIFSKLDKTKLSFVITNNKSYALQKVMPELLNSNFYTEIFIGQLNTPNAISQLISSDDFKNTFYYKKILDNAGSSYQYCVNAINYLKDCGIIISFNDKTVVTDSKTVIIPFGLEHLINTRLKRISKDTAKSLILAYSYILGPVIYTDVLDKLGLNNSANIEALEKSGYIQLYGNKLYIQNYETIKKSFKITLKPEVLKYLSNNLLSKVYTSNSVNTTVIECLNYQENYELEFSKLYELSIITLQLGDYDTYLKMCIRLLKLLKLLEKTVSAEEISEYQSDFYNNLTQLLYRYAPERIYPIAESLLQKALETNDSEKIITLSNMMLQGGLLTSNYTNSTTLLQNILERIDNCALADKNENINKKVFSLSLVSLEIYFYTGLYSKCITTSEDILSILTPEKIIQLKPTSFTDTQFLSHIQDSLIYYLISKILTGTEDLNICIEKIENSIGIAPKASKALNTINEAIQGKSVSIIPETIEDGSTEIYTKLINAIITNNGDSEKFASDIYEFKRAAQTQGKTSYVLLGDLLIGYAYKSMKAYGKAEHIYNSVYAKAKDNSLFFILYLSNYLLADLSAATGSNQTALQILTNSITILERAESPCIILLYLLKKKLVEIVETQKYTNIDIMPEKGYLRQLEGIFKGLSKLN